MEEEITLRVKYNETDSMRYLYHGNYVYYYHASRTELLRKVGLSDKKLESHGIILPVVEIYSKYLKPAFYDDELKVKSKLLKISGCKLHFVHEIYNPDKELINQGNTVVAYVNSSTRKPIKIPAEIKERLNFLINN